MQNILSFVHAYIQNVHVTVIVMIYYNLLILVSDDDGDGKKDEDCVKTTPS